MINKVMLAGRRTGKTTWIVNQWKEDGKKGLLITTTHRQARNILNNFHLSHEDSRRVMSIFEAHHNHHVHGYEKVYIDEYAFCQENLLWAIIDTSNKLGMEVNATSTPRYWKLDESNLPYWYKVFVNAEHQIRPEPNIYTKQNRMMFKELQLGHALSEAGFIYIVKGEGTE